MIKCSSCIDGTLCVVCQLKTSHLNCGYCNLKLEDCTCWEPEGPLGHDEEFTRVSINEQHH